MSRMSNVEQNERRELVEMALKGLSIQQERLLQELAATKAGPKVAKVPKGLQRAKRRAKGVIPAKRKHQMSAAGRKAIQAAQKARWAKIHRLAKKSPSKVSKPTKVLKVA